jgi:hypothetical protein
MHHRMSWLFVWLFLFCFACSGCTSAPEPNLPTAHPVTGTVVDAAGQPITGGTLQFEALASAGQMGIAEIQPDGAFTVHTFVDGHKLIGAVPGPQRVTYMPLMTEDQAAANPVTLTETFEVQAGGNEFTIKVPKGR